MGVGEMNDASEDSAGATHSYTIVQGGIYVFQLKEQPVSIYNVSFTLVSIFKFSQ